MNAMSSLSRPIICWFAVIISVVIGMSACSRDQSGSTPVPMAASGGQGLNVVFKTLPDPPIGGDNTLEVIVHQPDGQPVTDATVTVEFRMPAMPSMNMPEMHSIASLVHQGDGNYRGVGQLVMSGTWNVTLTVSRVGQEPGIERFTIIAK
jgi:nitrogen fixation protein FixH